MGNGEEKVEATIFKVIRKDKDRLYLKSFMSATRQCEDKPRGLFVPSRADLAQKSQCVYPKCHSSRSGRSTPYNSRRRHCSWRSKDVSKGIPYNKKQEGSFNGKDKPKH
eukprot:7702018-Ditylum_brightwellii.AAC.1